MTFPKGRNNIHHPSLCAILLLSRYQIHTGMMILCILNNSMGLVLPKHPPRFVHKVGETTNSVQCKGPSHIKPKEAFFTASAYFEHINWPSGIHRNTLPSWEKQNNSRQENRAGVKRNSPTIRLPRWVNSGNFWQ